MIHILDECMEGKERKIYKNIISVEYKRVVERITSKSTYNNDDKMKCKKHVW